VGEIHLLQEQLANVAALSVGRWRREVATPRGVVRLERRRGMSSQRVDHNAEPRNEMMRERWRSMFVQRIGFSVSGDHSAYCVVGCEAAVGGSAHCVFTLTAGKPVFTLVASRVSLTARACVRWLIRVCARAGRLRLTMVL